MWVCSGEIWSRYYFSKKKKVYVCECVFLLFLLNETIKKNLKKERKKILEILNGWGLFFLYLCDGFTEYIHFKFSNGVN